MRPISWRTWPVRRSTVSSRMPRSKSSKLTWANCNAGAINARDYFPTDTDTQVRDHLERCERALAAVVEQAVDQDAPAR